MKTGIIFSGTLRLYDHHRIIQYVLNEEDENEIVASCNNKQIYDHTVETIYKNFEIPSDWNFVNKSMEHKWNNYNTLSMFFHNYNAFNHLIATCGNFDTIIKFRSDVDFNVKFPLQTTLNDNTIYVPKIHHYCGINDQIAYGNQQSMQIYCDVYNNIEKYINELKVKFHPETLLKYHLDKNNIKVETFDFNYNLIPDRRNFEP